MDTRFRYCLHGVSVNWERGSGVIVSEVDVGMVVNSEFGCSAKMDVEEVDVGGTDTIVMGE